MSSEIDNVHGGVNARWIYLHLYLKALRTVFFPMLSMSGNV